VAGDPVVDLMLRHVAILGFTIVALVLLAVRRRARTLIEAGVVTSREVDGFVQGALVMAALGAATLWTLQAQSPDPACLLVFPPSTPAGRGFWLLDLLAALALLYWLWVRPGAGLLHRLTPAFSSRGTAMTHLTPHGWRILLTTVAVALPPLVYAMQRILPLWLARC